MSCLTQQSLAAFLDGEVTANHAAQIEAHLAGCADCRGRREHLARLADLMRSSAAPAPDPSFAAQVASRLHERPRRGPLWIGLGVAIPAAAALLLWPRGDRVGEFAPRGGAPDQRRERLVGFEAFVHPAGAPDRAARLAEKSPVAPGDGFTFTLYNRSGAPAFFMLLAVDAAGEVHWLHPAYIFADTDPASVPLAAAPQVSSLPEGVTPEGLAPGALQLAGIFSERPLRVREVEAVVARSGLAGLAEATVQVLPLVVEKPR